MPESSEHEAEVKRQAQELVQREDWRALNQLVRREQLEHPNAEEQR